MKKILKIITNNAKTILVIALLDLLTSTIAEIKRSQQIGKFDVAFDEQNKEHQNNNDTFDKSSQSASLVHDIKTNHKLGKLFNL